MHSLLELFSYLLLDLAHSVAMPTTYENKEIEQ